MERILADTNVLLRSAQPFSDDHLAAVNALVSLTAEFGKICVLPQNLIEFWNVATRPQQNNGLGWNATDTSVELARLETIFTILPDSQDIYTEWKAIVILHPVLRKQVHDARIAAAMKVHQITKLLTFNGKDFNRFSNVEVLDPNSTLSSDEGV